MENNDPVLDVDGETLQVGDPVILLHAPNELLSGLPIEDQVAINAQVGKAMSVQSFDERGHIELEFKCGDEMIHFIWVNSSNLRKSREK